MNRLQLTAAAGAALLLAGLQGCSSGSPLGSDSAPAARPSFSGGASSSRSGEAAPSEVFGLAQDDEAPNRLDDLELLVIERPENGTPLRVAQPGSGELITVVDDVEVRLPLEHTAVDIEVLGPVATGTVRQRFGNPYDAPIEAHYVFPLPHDAAVHDFVLTIGERTIRGVVREREEARRIYEAARAQGYTAALLTQERPNVFTQNVANILPGRPIDVTLAYLEPVDHRDGWCELAFPMVVGPRYNPVGFDQGIGAVGRGSAPSGQATDVTYLRENERSAADIDLSVRLATGLKVERLASPSHDVTIDEGQGGVTVRLAAADRIPNKDFRLRWRVAGDGVRTALVREGDHALLTLYPPDDLTGLPRQAVEHMFVIDTSGSMSGEPMAVVRRALHAALDRLTPEDTFHIMEFNSSRRSIAERAVPATERNLKVARRYVDGLTAGGGTEMLPAMEEALGRPSDGARKRVITFFTDGYIGNEDQVVAAIQRREADARIFAFGIGSSPNTWLMSEMARRSEGGEAYIGLGEDPAPAVAAYFERVSHPAVLDLDVRFEGAVATAAVDPPRSMLAGSPLTLPVALADVRGPVRARVFGTVAGRPVEIAVAEAVAVDPEERARGPVLGKVWARAHIGQLMADLRVADRELAARLGERMTRLALEHGLVSSTTSFLCVDSAAPVTDGGDPTRVDVAVPVPAGVEFETTVQDG